MTWTYSASSSGFLLSLNQVRLLIEDTSSEDQLLQDEEINYLVSLEGSAQAGAARASEVLWAKFARQCDKTVGSLSISLGQRADHYKALAARLRLTASSLALPYFGGISRTTVQASIEDTDRVIPSFYVGMMDNPPSQQGSSS